MVLNKKQILVTDDEPDIVEVISDMLRSRGYDISHAYSGKECLSTARTSKPDLIFLDIMMEQMDGWQVASLIKSDPELKDIPIIMVTARPLTFEDVKERAALIENYIMKPVSSGQLTEAIEEVFTSRTRVERTLEMARKSGVRDGIIEEYKERYMMLCTQTDRNRKLLILLSQLYTEKQLADKPAARNMMASLRKGLEIQEKELSHLETILTTP